jgi:RNA-directed DNA polymerase
MSTIIPRDEFIKVSKEAGHSEEFIQAAISYIDTLETKNLPVLFSIKHLCQILNINYNSVLEIINNREQFYDGFKLKKRRGGYRYIQSPNASLRVIQTWIHNKILLNVPMHENCFSFIKQKSIVDNANVHANADSILKLDLYRFFESIDQRKIYKVFLDLGYTKNVAIDLSKLTTILPNKYYESIILKDKLTPENFVLSKHGFLPQGSPTSPLLSNIVAKKLDIRLSGLAKSLNVNYSRYADDITFSGDRANLPKVSFIEKVLKEEGFYLNYKKTKLRVKGQRQIVTGLSISNGVHVPKNYKRKIRQHLHYCKVLGPEKHLENINLEKANFKDWLYGSICYIRSIEKDIGDKMLDDFDKINWLFYND